MDRLDNYLIESVFRKLPLEDILSCSRICKRFNSIITSSTVIQLFLYNHLLGHAFPTTPDHLSPALQNDGKARKFLETLSRMLKTEDNLRKYKPHLKVYQIPEDQMIRATGEECIVTSYRPDSDPAADAQGLFTLVTIWTPEDGKLKPKPVKVDFRPHFDLNSIVVDVNDNVIVCMREPEEIPSNVNKQYEWPIRAIHLFNEGDVGRSWPFEGVIATGFRIYDIPEIKLGRESLLLIHTSPKTTWTRWNEGLDAHWNIIELPFFYEVFTAEVFGPDLIAIIGSCVSPNLREITYRREFSNLRNYLFIYRIDKHNRQRFSTPQLVLRLPWARNEWSHPIRGAIPHTVPGDATLTPSLSNSNNGSSAVIQAVFELLDSDGQMWPDDGPTPYITISLPLTAIRNMLDAPPQNLRRNPKRTVRTTLATTSIQSVNIPNETDSMCECCVEPDEPTEQLGIDVLAPPQWQDKAYMSYWPSPREMPQYPRIYGTKVMEYFRGSQDLNKTDGQALTELHMTDYNAHKKYEPGNHRALGGLGQKLKLPKGGKDTGRIRVSGLRTWSPTSRGYPIPAIQTEHRGRFNDLPAKGLIKNVIFDGERLIFEHVGWITVLDFA